MTILLPVILRTRSDFLSFWLRKNKTNKKTSKKKKNRMPQRTLPFLQIKEKIYQQPSNITSCLPLSPTYLFRNIFIPDEWNPWDDKFRGKKIYGLPMMVWKLPWNIQVDGLILTSSLLFLFLCKICCLIFNSGHEIESFLHVTNNQLRLLLSSNWPWFFLS